MAPLRLGGSVLGQRSFVLRSAELYTETIAKSDRICQLFQLAADVPASGDQGNG